MDTSLAHLPSQKQDELHRVVAIIRQHCPAARMVILFGSYARGDWREAKDLAPDRRSGHASDYDILAVTEKVAECDVLAWQAIDRACVEAGLSAYPRIIHHDIGFLNRKLEKGQYFFSDVIAEGKMLYDAGAFSLVAAKVLSAAERLEIARKDFEHWFRRAEEFYGYYKVGIANGWRETAAFNLHQVSEACYKTVLLVHTGYIPDEHYLTLLGMLVSEIEPAFADVFPTCDEFQSEAFRLLDAAYIGARYHKDFTVDEPTLNYLAERVAALMELTREKCEAKMAALERAGG